MSGVEFIKVSADDAGCRLDKWLKRRYAQLTQGQIQKLLRSKQIKVDGKKVEASFHVEVGQTIRIPPLPEKGSVMKNAADRRARVEVSETDCAFVKSLVLHKDAHIIVINKPAGLAVQGGTGQTRHLDGMLSALRFEKDENPRLVHRLDKETSGVLVLARTPAAASKLADAFAKGLAQKVYWALVDGVPAMKEGRIDAKLLKVSGENGGESVVVDEKNGVAGNDAVDGADASVACALRLHGACDYRRFQIRKRRVGGLVGKRKKLAFTRIRGAFSPSGGRFF